MSATLARDVDILVSGNRITWIRPHQDGAEAGAARYIDASALTLMPGLWDASVHPSAARFGAAAPAMLAYGITSALSAGGPLHQGIALREALDAGNMIGPRLFAATPLLGGNRVTESFARSVRTADALDLELAKASRMGVEFVAAGARSGAADEPHRAGRADDGRAVRRRRGRPRRQRRHRQRESAAAAAAPGLRLAAALRGARAPGAIVLAGLRRDAQQQAGVIAAGALVSNGGPSALAAPGLSLHLNLRAAGMALNRHQALQTVTINAARHARVDQDLGSVEPGKLADLVAVRGNPLHDLGAAANVEYVIKNGNVFTVAQILAPFQIPPALPCADPDCGGAVQPIH